VAATPLEPAPPALAAFAGRDELWLKREDAHELGAFKWRAALPVVGELAAAGHAAVVTASTGNHGAAVAWACARHGATAVVFVPPDANEGKLALLRRLGADVRVAGRDLDDAKAAGIAYAEAEGLRFFEDGAEPLQYEAYGAIGGELLAQSPAPPAAVVIPVGNGALAVGIGEAVGRGAPAARRVGVVAHALPVMAASWEAGRPVEGAPGETIADGLAVRVAIPLAVERLANAVDAFVRLSERELAAALVACHDAGVEVEPSGASAVAAVRARPDVLPAGPVVLVVTGRNADPAVLARARADLDSFPERD
jgi:threonine dehydratase